VTEQEWMGCTNLKQMLTCHRGNCHWTKRLLVLLGMSKRRVCMRKLRLFLCACLRRFPVVTRDSPSIDALGLCEQYADGLVSKQELHTARITLPKGTDIFWPTREVVRSLLSADGEDRLLGVAYLASLLMAKMKVGSHHYSIGDTSYPARLERARLDEVRTQSQLLRDILGSPFAKVVVSPSWRTATVLQLARTIYHEHVSYLMPVMGKALHEAGCDDDTILNHCRQPSVHARGCWLIDLLLGSDRL